MLDLGLRLCIKQPSSSQLRRREEPRSGRAALKHRMHALGVELDEEA